MRRPLRPRRSQSLVRCLAWKPSWVSMRRWQYVLLFWPANDQTLRTPVLRSKTCTNAKNDSKRRRQIVKKRRRKPKRQPNASNGPDASLNGIGGIILRRRCPARRHRRRPALNRVTVGLGHQRLRKEQHRRAGQEGHEADRVDAD